MAEGIKATSRLTFGKHRGKKLSECSDEYLTWMVENLWDGDFHCWAFAAKELLEARKNDPLAALDAQAANAEAVADALLRRAGYNPKKV